MKKAIKVSVILPSLNSAEYIDECITSVINQTLREIEIICVDAGSTDGTLKILQHYAQEDPRIHIIISEKKSYGYQINLGLDYANGKYLGIVETDDYIKPKMYETLYSIAEKNQTDVLKDDFCTFQHLNGERKFSYKRLISDKTLYNRVLNPQNEIRAFWAYVINPPGLYRLDFLRENKIRLNETPGASYQDNGLWFQMFALAKRVYLYNEPFYMVRRDNPNSSIKSKEKVYCICEEYDFIREFLKKNPELESRLATVCTFFRFGNYCCTIDRIGPQFKRDFIKKFSKDFIKIEADGELDKQYFSQKQSQMLCEIMEDPEKYYFTKIHIHDYPSDYSEKNFNVDSDMQDLQRKLKEIERKFNDIKTSYSYRIGSSVTYIPRKIVGGLKCIQDHGLLYTWNLSWQKINERMKYKG